MNKSMLTVLAAAALTVVAGGLALAQTMPTPMPMVTPAPMATPPSVPSSLPMPGATP